MELQEIAVVNGLHDQSSTIDEELGSEQSAHQTQPIAQCNLLHYCAANKNLLLFLQITGTYSVQNGSLLTFDKLWFALSLCLNIASVAANFIFMCLALFIYNYPSSSLRYASAGIDFAIFIRTSSVLPAQYMNNQRLRRPANKHDILVLSESTNIALIFGVVSTAATIAATILMALGTEPTYAASYFTEFFLGTVLAFNMFFLILDIRASALMLDELHLLVDNKQLTMDKFVSVREEIHGRVKESLWACDLIIVPCLASIAAILVLILFFLDRTNRAGVQYETVAFIAYMLKELFFVAVAFWYVAKVNARADELTVKLSRSMWGSYKDKLMGPDNTSSTMEGAMQDCTNNTVDEELGKSETVSLLSEPVQMIDMHRVSIHASSVSEPISFTLLFMRVSWKNVAVSAVGVFTTVVIALIRSIVSF